MVVKHISDFLKTQRKVLSIILLFAIQPMLSQSEEGIATTDAYTIEKVYLHLNKTFFMVGEDIWFKIYLVDGETNKPSRLSEIVYVELIDSNGKIVQKKTFKLNEGTAPGDFNLQLQSGKGVYFIRAYTNYMRNFDDTIYFQREIYFYPINAVEGKSIETNSSKLQNFKPDLQFFPEGGQMINSFLNPIAFKATNNHGYGMPVSGKIIDDKGRKVTDFSSSHLGMGLFYFIPKKGISYSAVIYDQGDSLNYTLPAAEDKGVLMTIVETDNDYKVNLQSTEGIGLNGFTISGRQKQRTIFSAEVSTKEQMKSTVVKVPKEILLEGITEITLFDSDNTPVAERLLLHTLENSNLQSTISTSSFSYGPRSPVNLDINLNHDSKEKIIADLSLSVNNTKVIADEIDKIDIKTYLLLSTELKGTVEQPGYYFYSTDPQRKKNLDLLMRTQGWRQYLLNDDLEKTETYFQPEVGLSLSGKVVSSLNPGESLIGTIFLTSNNSKEMVQDKVETDSAGNFIFKNLNFIDTTSVLLNADVHYAKKKNTSTANYTIVLDSIPSPKITSEALKPFYIRPEKVNNIGETYVLTNRTIQLDEAFIEVKTSKIEDKFERKRKIVPYKEPSQTVHFENFPELGFISLLQALRGRVPGLSVRGSYAYLRGSSSLSNSSSNSPTESGSALILLDGTPVGSNILEQMLPSEVEFVDVLKGPRAAIYGSRAANGIIAIYTKNGTEKSAKKGVVGGSLNFTHPGYNYPRKFYEPKYHQKLPDHNSSDNRTTLHWQPNVVLNEYGKAKISFYTSDILGDYTVDLEGLTSEGKLIKNTTYFEVKKE